MADVSLEDLGAYDHHKTLLQEVVFVALLQGILVAYRDTSTQDILQNLPTVKHGDDLGGRLFARIDAYRPGRKNFSSSWVDMHLYGRTIDRPRDWNQRAPECSRARRSSLGRICQQGILVRKDLIARKRRES